MEKLFLRKFAMANSTQFFTTCASCNFENRQGVTFCESCGKSLESACSNCGDTGPPSRKFCGNCGHALEVDTSQKNAGESAIPGIDEDDHAERRHLTVLFCDMVGSTDLAQQLDPEELSVVIKTFNDTIHTIMHRFGGYVARYMGDGMLVYFGYPQSFEDNAERSIRAGLGVVEAVSHIDNGLGEPLKARVGIATGRVVTGAAARTDSGVETLALGNTPNLAARLQSIAEPGSVAVADSTKRTVRGIFNWTDLGSQEMRGFLEPQQVWRVDSTDTGEMSDSSRLDSISALLDREDELEFLERRLRRAAGGKLEIVNVVGEAGVGKTRLTREFYESLDRESYSFLPLVCSELGRETALYPLRKFFEETAGIAEASSSQAFENLSTYVRSQTTPGSESLNCLAHSLGIDVAQSGPVDSLSPRERQKRAFQLVQDILVEQSNNKPMLLLIEDLHWMDPTSLEWLSELVQSEQLRNILILVTTRPGYEDFSNIAPDARTIPLGRMSTEVSQSLISNITGGKSLPDDVVEMITVKADGVPLFVEEITQSILESGVMVLDGDRYIIEGGLDQIGVPDSLQDTLMSRLDRVAWVRDIAQTASVIGREFTETLLTQVTRRPGAEIDNALVELEKTGLVRQRRSQFEEAWEFKHALVRDAAYESILKSLRRTLHGLIAGALKDSAEGGQSTRPELLAYHLGESGNSESAISHWQRAAEIARNKWANSEAVGHLRHAITEIDRLDPSHKRDVLELELQVSLGEASRSARGASASIAMSAYNKAVALCGDGDGFEMNLVLKAYHGLFISYFSTAQLKLSREPADKLLDIGERLKDRIGMVAGCQSAGMQYFATGDLEKAHHYLDRALELGRKMSSTNIDIQFPELCQGYLSWTLHLLGEHERALELSNQSIESARNITPYHLAMALGNACYLHQFRDDQEKIRQLSDELIQLASEKDLPSWESVGEFFRCWLNCEQEPTNEHAIALENALQLWKEDEIETPYFKSIAGQAIAKSPLAEDGARLLEEAKSLMISTGETWYRPHLEKILKDIHRD